MATLILPRQVPIHLNIIGTQKGAWLVRVESVLASRECDEVALHLMLQKTAEEEPASTRRLYMVCSERDLHIPQQRAFIADHIRHWLESTEGNGVLQEVNHAA